MLVTFAVQGSGFALADTKRDEQYHLKANSDFYFGEQKAALLEMNSEDIAMFSWPWVYGFRDLRVVGGTR